MLAECIFRDNSQLVKHGKSWKVKPPEALNMKRQKFIKSQNVQCQKIIKRLRTNNLQWKSGKAIGGDWKKSLGGHEELGKCISNLNKDKLGVIKT